MEIHSCASLVPIFNHLDDDEIIRISSITKHRRFNKGDIISSPGDMPSIYIIAKGAIKEYFINYNGDENLIRIYRAGDVIGELSVFDEPSELYNEAMSDVDLCYITQESINELMINHPSIAIKLLKEYGKRLRKSDLQNKRLATGSISARLASYLIDEAKNKQSNAFRLELSLKEIANFLATTPETISRKLKLFEENNIIKRQNKNIEIINYKLLEDEIYDGL